MKKLYFIVSIAFFLHTIPAAATRVTSKSAAKSVAQETTATDANDDLTARLVVGGKNDAPAAAPEAPAAATAIPAPAMSSPVVPAAETAPEAAVKPAETAKLPENQIPVLTGAKDPKKASGGGMSRILISLGVLTAALAAAVFGLKRVTNRKAERNKNTRIKVLTQHALGPKKSLAIVQVAGESILIGITDQNISMLKSIALIDDEFPEDLPREFSHALDDYEEAPSSRRSRAPSTEQDDFAVQGLSEIRDKVSTRLRSMKNL